MRAFTDLGDAYVTLPLLLLAWGALAAAGRPGSPARLASVVVPALALVALLKILIGAFPVLGAWIAIRSPSGHAASSALATGAFCLLGGAGRSRAVAAAGLAGLAIGASRVAVGAHTPAEALAGASAGTVAVAVLARRLGACPLDRRARPALLACGVMLVGAIWGRHAPIERGLVAIEHDLREGRA